jgi:hypothetical protein
MADTNWERNYKQNTARYFLRNKEKLYAHYGDRCKCCGEKQKAFLTIDHVNNDGAIERKQYPTTNTMIVHIIKSGFPDTYQILCYNCNNGKRKTGLCPHKMYSSIPTINDTRIQ